MAEAGLISSVIEFFEESPAIVGVAMGPEFTIRFINRPLRVAIGERRPILGRPIREALPELAPQGLIAIAERVYETGESFTSAALPIVIDVDGDGTMVDRHFSFTVQAIKAEGGASVGLFFHGIDVSAEVTARREMEATRTRYLELVDSMNAIVWEGDVSSGQHTFVSRRAEGLLGYPQSAWTSFDFQVGIIHQGDRERVLEEGARAAAGGSDGFEVEYRAIAANGNELWLHNSVRFVRGPDGLPSALRGVIVDITPLKRAEVDRERAKQQLADMRRFESLGLLAGGIAHDFNNLLTAMLGNASLAERHIEPQHPARAAIDDVIESAKKAAELTGQLLAYAGRGRFHTKRLDLSNHVREMQALLLATVPKPAILTVDLEAELPPIKGDVSTLQQILLSLVINAGQAIQPSSGRVWVKTGTRELSSALIRTLVKIEEPPPGRYVYLEVGDDGPGIPSEIVGQIFDPFLATNALGKRRGLATVLELANQHGGAVEIERERASGACVRVYFPEAGMPSSPGTELDAHSIRGAGIVLIIDDEVWVRGTTRRMLEHLGYSVLEAPDGPSGLALFNRSPEVVVVMLDLTMPDMPGHEVFKRLRAISPAMPIVISSGFSESELDWVAAEGPTVIFLEKPYTLERLGQSLAKVRAAAL